MRNIFYFLMLSILTSACKVTQISEDKLLGTYIATGKDYNYNLQLNGNNTFDLKFKSLEVTSGCKGKWTLTNDIITLTCNEPKNVEETLQGGYMSNRILELKVRNEKELVYNSTILKKINP